MTARLTVVGALGVGVCLLASATAPGEGPASGPATTSRPATATEKALRVRALLEQAVRSRDSARAAPLLEEAAALLKEIHDLEAMTLAAYKFKAKGVSMDHLLRVVRTTRHEKTTPLTPRLSLVERSVRNEYPFTAMAENDRGLIMAVPCTSDDLEEQDLRWDGASLYTVRRVNAWKQFHASPDSRKVLLADWLRAGPMLVLDTASRKIVAVPEPEGLKGQSHDYGYAFGFLRWAGDSKSFLVEATGTIPSHGRMTAYRECWRIDPETGKAARVSRTEKPWTADLKWDAPATAPAN